MTKDVTAQFRALCINSFQTKERSRHHRWVTWRLRKFSLDNL